VKRARFTLLPALGEGFKRLVKGGTCFQKPPEEVYISAFILLSASFQPKKTRLTKEKKIIAMPSGNHHDVSTKPSQCFFQTIVKTLLYHHEESFVPFRRLKKTIMMSSRKHYSVLEKAL
jgi:hypothetical protein